MLENNIIFNVVIDVILVVLNIDIICFVVEFEC